MINEFEIPERKKEDLGRINTGKIMCKYKKFTLFVIEGVFLMCLELYVKFLFEGVIVIFVGANVCYFVQ